jgi:hypothetical protein
MTRHIGERFSPSSASHLNALIGITDIILKPYQIVDRCLKLGYHDEDASGEVMLTMPSTARSWFRAKAIGRLANGLAAIVVFAIAAGTCTKVQAQSHHTNSQVPRYEPQSPTVSPYLSLLSGRGGPVTNYYGLVRPQASQHAINQIQSIQTSSQQQQINTIKNQEQDYAQPKIKPTGTAGWFQTYGETSASPYQQPGHYYSQWQKPRPRHTSTSGR